jgi:putative tryptophan/tyrosine transport system substrate-binding protein
MNRVQIATLATQLGVPAIFPFREFAAAGGLMSYGTSLGGAYREAGVYASRILNGANPSELPVLQPTSFQLKRDDFSLNRFGIPKSVDF